MKTTPQSIKSSGASRIPNLAAAAVVASFIVWASPLHAAAYTWSGAGANNSWGTASNWVGNVAPAFTNTDDLEFNTLTRGTNSVGANRSARSITFGADIDDAFVVNYNTFNAGTGVNLTMAADSGDASITVASGAAGNITMGTNTGWTGTFSNLVLATNLNVIHNGTGLLLFNRPYSGAGISLTKSGSGTMQVNNFNTNFTGVYNVNGGTLIANAGATNSGFDLDTAAAINLSNGALQIRGNFGLSKTYSNTPINVNGPSSLAWNNTNTNSTFTLTVSGTNTLALNAGLVVTNASSNTALNNLITISRSITGSGDLTNIGYNNITSNTNNYTLGRLALSGTNTNWNGNLVVARGTVNIGGNGVNSPGGSGTFIIGATGDSFGAGLGVSFTTNVIPLNGNVYLSNNLVVRSGGFRSLRPAGDHIVNFLGNITLEGSLNVDSALNFYTDKWINLLGNISGAGGLDITRTSFGGHVELGGSNSYLGATTISSSATLQVNSPSGQAIPDTSAVTISGPIVTNGVHVFTPTLRVLTSETVGSLASSGSEQRVVFSNNAVLTAGGDNSSTTFGGSVSGAGGLTKAGSGTMTLNGPISHTGNTLVNGGQIELGTNATLAFLVGGVGTNNSVSGPGSALFRGVFTVDLTAASTNAGDSWTLVSVAVPAYDGSFSVAGFTNSGGTWSLQTNGATYQFAQSSGILSVLNTNATPYDGWTTYWQTLYPGFTNTAPGDNPDGDPFDNGEEFAFDGNPAVGSPALLRAAKSGTNTVFSWVERNTGATYQVQGAASLSVGPWTNTTGLTITNSPDQSGISQTNLYTRKEFTVPGAGSSFTRIKASVAP
jgi:fibronectin-binding autotransporter adhesin